MLCFRVQALPAFRSLLFARSPVALSIADCAAVPAIMKASKATVRPPFQKALLWMALAHCFCRAHDEFNGGSTASQTDNCKNDLLSIFHFASVVAVEV